MFWLITNQWLVKSTKLQLYTEQKVRINWWFDFPRAAIEWLADDGEQNRNIASLIHNIFLTDSDSNKCYCLIANSCYCMRRQCTTGPGNRIKCSACKKGNKNKWAGSLLFRRHTINSFLQSISAWHQPCFLHSSSTLLCLLAQKKNVSSEDYTFRYRWAIAKMRALGEPQNSGCFCFIRAPNWANDPVRLWIITVNATQRLYAK